MNNKSIIEISALYCRSFLRVSSNESYNQYNGFEMLKRFKI